MKEKIRKPFRHRDAKKKEAKALNKAALVVSSSLARFVCLLEKSEVPRFIL
jgi:hypothetical protein